MESSRRWGPLEGAPAAGPSPARDRNARRAREMESTMITVRPNPLTPETPYKSDERQMLREEHEAKP